MNLISASYGNDSVAMIQWAHEAVLSAVTVVYCNTGWAAPYWAQRVEKGEALAKSYGFATHRVKSAGMEQLVRDRKGFPANQYQFCTAELKAFPINDWMDEIDPKGEAVMNIGKRRDESEARKTTEEYIYESEYHGGRTVRHPLFAHTQAMRDELLDRAGFGVLPHRSRECSPCVNANRQDFLDLTPGEIERVNKLEVEIARPMYRPKRFGAMGIYGVVAWAEKGRNRGDIEIEESNCGDMFGCGM